MPDAIQPAEDVGYVLCDDLIFTSRITGTAQALGIKLRPARSAETLRTLVLQQPPRCVIVDLGNPGLKLAELVEFLRLNCPAMPRVVAYGSHVDADGLHAARAAGCDPVLPRSKFVEELPRALPEWIVGISPRQ